MYCIILFQYENSYDTGFFHIPSINGQGDKDEPGT
jgi:hypothetical protein